MLSLDTETTGLDVYHGCRPYLVTTCDGEENEWWEWYVDPLTRKPKSNPGQARAINRRLARADRLILQNTTFDYKMLEAGLADAGVSIRWDWSKVEDTLIAGHLLGSNQPHDLSSMVLYYLGVNIQPLEDDVRTATLQARTHVKNTYPKWIRAEKGLACMPSAGKQVWKADMWLMRLIAKKEKYPKDHPWWTVTSEYANGDSSSTFHLFLRQEKLLKERGLWKLYKERLKLLPIIVKMQNAGVTLSESRLKQLVQDYRAESASLGRTCSKIARSYKYDLCLPKGGRNNSLMEFMFGDKYLRLKPVKTTKGGSPSVDSDSLEEYAATLPPKSKSGRFVKALTSKRKRDTALTYMEAYRRFWLPVGGVSPEWHRLHPSLNPTGSHTLRWSSSNPNEQNISKKEGFNLRYCFGPTPGREWWSLDYDNLELRIPAYIAGEQEMIRLFERPNDPPYYGSYHLLVASILHPKKWEDCLKRGKTFKEEHPTLYGMVKNGNFADQYGAVEKSNGWGTADRAYGVRGGQSKVRKRLSKIAKLNAQVIAQANQRGYIETLPDHTVDPRRGYPLFCSYSPGRGRVKPTLPLNYKVQGTACWIINRAMVKVDNYLEDLSRRNSNQYLIIMQVHDELVLDFPYRKNKGNLVRVRKVQRLMESVGKDISVPLTCGVEYHPNNWSEGESV